MHINVHIPAIIVPRLALLIFVHNLVHFSSRKIEKKPNLTHVSHAGAYDYFKVVIWLICAKSAGKGFERK